MSGNKITTLTIRINPKFKEGLRMAAKREHRSITNMIEILIRDYCDQNDICTTELDNRLPPCPQKKSHK
jgi:hypothetical protein